MTTMKILQQSRTLQLRAQQEEQEEETRRRAAGKKSDVYVVMQEVIVSLKGLQQAAVYPNPDEGEVRRWIWDERCVLCLCTFVIFLSGLLRPFVLFTLEVVAVRVHFLHD